MDDPRILGPIPTPPAQRWREVRLLYLPRAVFVLGVIVVAILWSRSVTPSAIVAEAEIIQAEVRSAQAGTVASLSVAMLQAVRAGEVVGQVVAANPRILDATLSVIRAEVGMLSASMAGATDKQRMAIEFERLQIESMDHRIELAGLQVRLQQAEADFGRAGALHRAGLITQENFEQLKANRDALAAQAGEQSRMVAHLEPIIKNYASPDALAAGLSPDTALAAAIKVQEAKLQLAEAQLTPMPLVAPIDGVVSEVLRRAGESVMAGEAVLRIHATKSLKLTGFLRQPLLIEPKAGMTAEIRTRTSLRQVATTKITEVGAAMEPISPSLIAALRLPTSPMPEHALRIQLAMPAGITLRPGEHVDVTIR
ncbi:MAG: HlyD family efflux transporter periplasmic adaptor subunit [Opitutus sp.]|nr:HlyD family efflux transporter periplasmic adaptor subunit [Opitutus sp.]